jgi:hypothetical protein
VVQCKCGWKEKSDEEAKKEQRKEINVRVILVTTRGLKYGGAANHPGTAISTLYSCEFLNVGLKSICCIRFKIGVRMDEPLLNKASDHMVYSFLMTKMSWLFHKTSSKRVPLTTDGGSYK